MHNTIIQGSLKCVGVALGWTTFNLSFSAGLLASILSIMVSIVVFLYFVSTIYRSHVLRYYKGNWKAWIKDVFWGFWKK